MPTQVMSEAATQQCSWRDGAGELSEEAKQQFWRDGFLLVEGLNPQEEVAASTLYPLPHDLYPLPHTLPHTLYPTGVPWVLDCFFFFFTLVTGP